MRCRTSTLSAVVAVLVIFYVGGLYQSLLRLHTNTQGRRFLTAQLQRSHELLQLFDSSEPVAVKEPSRRASLIKAVNGSNVIRFPWERQHKRTITVRRPLWNRTDLFAPKERCALNFYGLPRSFRSLVLPSVIRNILLPNARYDCDIFVNTHWLLTEPPSRSGRGGDLHPEEIYLMEPAAQIIRERAHGSSQKNGNYSPSIIFQDFTDHDLWQARGTLLNLTRTYRNQRGNLKYFPWKSRDYVFPKTTDNVVRMWHSIDSVWRLMSTTALQKQIVYTRVAMFRVDVVYVTPIDIWKNPITGTLDYDNRIAVIPGFAKYPVNDSTSRLVGFIRLPRAMIGDSLFLSNAFSGMIYGPAQAVGMWASRRFDLIHYHVHQRKTQRKGMGIHSEYFLNEVILPFIRRLNVTVNEDPNVCFLRSRADETLWLNDCSGNRHSYNRFARLVEETIERRCKQSELTGEEVKANVIQLECKSNER